ncbi:MAG: conjugal transfer protein TraF [Acidobacteria bacterium]|nr:conjugal transfer protein TraF [Acidobacteriota bacterium]
MSIQVIRMALLCLLVTVPAHAQIVETVGSRALGMGGAFVAVASDSSATWWNPAGLAAGPFVDVAWGKGVIETTPGLPAVRYRPSWVALATPPLGMSVYRFRITDIQRFTPIDASSDGRQDSGAGVFGRSLSVTQVGATVLRTVAQGIHVGATLKYVRGTVRTRGLGRESDPGELLDSGEELEGGSAESRFDLDLGLLSVAGPFRIGALVRNVREPRFGSVALPGASSDQVRLPRQFRVGMAFSPDDSAVPTVALDADLRPYDTPAGERQVVAVGAEQWFGTRRFGVRAGGRLNTRGARERTATIGGTVALRGGLFIDGHAAGGGASSEEGWGVAARVSF